MKPKRIDDRHREYDEHYPDWKMCEDAVKGERAIHEGGTLYLPKLAEEPDADYAARVKRTPFFNATKQTLTALVGMMFSKPAVFDKPAGLDAYLDDIDMDGTPFDEFAERGGVELMKTGKVGLLVDRPPGIEGETVAQAEARGLRPSIKRYDAKTIINWRYARVANRSVLVRAVLCEAHEDYEDKIYRELLLTEVGYIQRLWEIDKAIGKEVQIGADIVPLMNGSPLMFIPFYIIGDGCPPLLDLVQMNVHHYQVAADYEGGCHLSGLPTAFIYGHQKPVGGGEKNIYVGGTTFNILPRPEAKAEFVEVTSEFKALRQNLQDKQAMMAVLGARMLETQRPGVEAAETAAIHRKGEEAQLSALARELSQGCTKALAAFAAWANVGGDVSWRLPTDYAILGLSAQELTAVVAGWMQGGYSSRAKFDYLKRRGFYPDEMTFEEEEGRTVEQGIGAPPSVG